MKGKSLGPYEILELLGAGGMGEVYRARDTKLGRQVAIKILPAAVSADSERVARLEREAQFLASLNHPNIASIYNMDEHEGTRFLVLELVDGESLRERLRRGPIPVPEALEIGRQVADALKAAHDEGIVHRDLKPANVMVTHEGGRVKVLDFGIAKVLKGEESATSSATGLTETGTTLGTTPYMSPEQLRGAAIDHRSDIWAFGCLLYEALAGRSPFARATAAASMAAILETDPDWGALPSATPSGVRAVLRRCLERDPSRRYGDLAKARSELEASADAMVASARGGRLRLARWALAGAVVVLGLSGLWAAGMLPGSSASTLSADLGPITSLAVLPFINLSGDAEQAYIAAAMTEMLTTDLGALSSLRVSGRESAIQFADSDLPSDQIAAQLDVDALVRGSLVLIGDDVVITARLIDARIDRQLWTDLYKGTALEVFGLMNEAVEAIADQIGALTTETRRRLAAAPELDARAVQLFWRGFTELENYTEDPIHTAIGAFGAALEIEPEYAMAHAELARAYLLAIQFGYMSSDETLPMVRASSERALEIDPTLAEARVALARLDYQASRDWDGLEETFGAVVDDSPNSVGAWHWYSHMLASKLKLGDAIDAARRGRDVDPLSRTMRLHLAQVYRQARRWDDVIAIADSTLNLYPDYSRIRGARADAYLWTGQIDAAIREFETLVGVSREPDNIEDLARAYAKAGREADARQLLGVLMEEGGGPFRIGSVYTALGELDLAFDWLSRAVDENVGQIGDLVVSPSHDPLRADTTRWRALLRRAGFSEDLVIAEVAR